MEKCHLHPAIFTISSVLSSKECEDLVQLTDRRGYSAAPVTTAFGPRYIPEIRDNTRVMYDDPSLAAHLFARIESLLPEAWHELSRSGLNERFRFYRYEKGEAFRWHRDGAFVRSANERSALTVMVYLNEGFEGGATEFDLPGGQLHVVPRTGMALVFDHRLLHQGAPVAKGTKYVMRTDAMYAAYASGAHGEPTTSRSEA